MTRKTYKHLSDVIIGEMTSYLELSHRYWKYSTTDEDPEKRASWKRLSAEVRTRAEALYLILHSEGTMSQMQYDEIDRHAYQKIMR